MSVKSLNGNLLLTQHGSIAIIEISDPQNENRLSKDILLGLIDICRELQSNQEIHVVILRGSGNQHFSLGILTPQLKHDLGKHGVLERVELGNRLCDAVENLPQLVIGALNGEARAGAVELALACDLRVAAAHVRLSLPEAQWGCFPGAGAPVRLPFLIGPSRALELIVMADVMDAKELLSLGVINRVFESETFDQSVMAYAQKIASRGPQALRGAKAIIRSRIDPGFTGARRLSDALRHAFEFTPDADEGVLAHMEGRTPRFIGKLPN